MNLLNDNIKIKFVREGYLPNWPYHEISNEEMCDAFISNGDGYFYDNYPLLDESLKDQYDELVSAISYHLDKMRISDDPDYMLPYWVYSYMVGSVISINSDTRDIHDLLVCLNVDNIDDIFTPAAQQWCYQVSKGWISKLTIKNLDHRPPTMFGELHVVKALRLLEATEV